MKNLQIDFMKGLFLDAKKVQKPSKMQKNERYLHIEIEKITFLDAALFKNAAK